MIEAPTPMINNKIIEFSSTTDKQTKINIKIIPSNSELEFSAKVLDKNPQKYFYIKETETNLLKNNYLATGGNIFGILQILEYYINKKAYKTYEENNSIKLEINIEHPIIKYINFTLLEAKKDINTQISELSFYVYETLVNKIQSLENINKEYENRIQNLENKNKEYENKFQEIIEINKKNETKINELEKKVNDLLKNKISEIKPKIFNSKIEIDEELVKSWLNNRRFYANLLFRMSEDGDKIDTFHKKCDNKGITITFIETEDGLRFWGYTELEWDTYSREKTDDKTFIFSFNYKEKYNKRNKKYSIGCFKTQGPKFGWGPQINFNNINLRKGISIKSEDNSFVLNNKFTNGKEEWNTKEIEIYQIKYY